MAKKLSDTEYAERHRAANRRRTERYQQRLAASGKTALTVWIPDTLKTALTEAAAERSATLADTATQWLMTAAALTTTNRNASNDSTVDLFGDSEPDTTPGESEKVVQAEPAPKLTQAERDERDRAILELHRQGLKNPEIGERFNTSEGSIRRALQRAKTLV